MRLLPPKKNSVTICLIVRDEAHYILEWIAHYQSLGVSDFIVYDNESQDGTTGLLKALAASDIIQYFPIGETDETQRIAYADAVNHCRTEWMGYIDADEFVNLTEHDSLQKFLGTFDADVASVSLSWRSFGSNSWYHFDKQPVTTRFTHSGIDQSFGNMWCKYFVRVKSLIRPDIHFCEAKPGMRHVIANGQPREFFVNHQLVPNYEVARLHHYAIKSHEEALTKTKVRGQVVGNRLDKYTEVYMTSIDVNDVQDLSLALRWGYVSEFLEKIQKVSFKKGWHDLFQTFAPTTPRVLAKENTWPLVDASMKVEGTRPQSPNLKCLVLSNEPSIIHAVTSILAGLDFKISPTGVPQPDVQLHDSLTLGNLERAAERAKEIINQGSEVLAISLLGLPQEIWESGANQILHKLALVPERVVLLGREPMASAIKSKVSLEEGLATYQRLVQVGSQISQSRLWVSSESALQNSGELIVRLADFMGMPLTPLDYQAIKYRVGDHLGLRLAWSKELNGSLESALNGEVRGWVRKPSADSDPVDVQVFVNNKPIAVLTANLSRAKDQHLAPGYRVTGTPNSEDCGFHTKLPEWVRPGDTIRVLAQNNTRELNGSPTVYLG